MTMLKKLLHALALVCICSKKQIESSCNPIVTSKFTDVLNIRNVGGPQTEPIADLWQMNARYLGSGFTSANGNASNENARIEWGEGFYSGAFSITPDDYQAVVGGGPHFVYSIDLTNEQLRPIEFSFDASVNEFGGSGVGQLVFFIYAKHKITGAYVVVLWALFDNRYDDYTPFNGNDTLFDFFSMPVHRMSATRMEKNPFALKHYSINLTRERWSTIASEPMENYILAIPGFLQESFVDPTQSITLGVSVKNIKITNLACDSQPAGDDLT